MKEKVFICTVCGKVHSENEDYEFAGQHLCRSCYESETVICRRCGERIWCDDAVDENLCHYCYDTYYTRCERCDRVIHIEDAHYDDDDYDNEYPYCYECHSDRCDDNAIHDYYYKPSPIFYGTSRRYYGIEVEIDEGGEYDGNAERILDIANSRRDHIYVKHDGSLDAGFEMVSHPMTLEYHTNNMPWRRIFSLAVAMGYRSHQQGTCGLHVHINRNGLGNGYDEQEAAIAKILYFYEKFWNEILKFSRRTESQVDRWCRRYGGGLISPKETLKHAKSSCLGRYVAVNLENDNTIEIRIFRGTLKYETFMATLQFVDSICDAAVSLSDEKLQNLTWLDFVQSIGNDKQELINYLKTRRLYVNEPVTSEEEM